MKVLINPKIIISNPVKNKCFGFQITLSKKDTNHLIIKAKSADGRSRGVVGKISRNGNFFQNNTYKNQLPKITASVQIKIDVTLDLVFGKNRDKQIELADNGMINFKNK